LLFKVWLFNAIISGCQAQFTAQTDTRP